MVHEILKFKGYGRDIELRFYSRITLLGGNSGIGKSVLYQLLTVLSAGYKFKNIYCINSDIAKTQDIDLIKTFQSKKNHLIVIDNSEEILGKKEREFILTNIKNQYLILGRNRDGLSLGYKSLGELVVDDKKIYIKYRLKEESEALTHNIKLRFDFDLP